MPLADSDALAGIALRLSQALGHRYRIERELGRGGMAVVFLAHDLRHSRRVAIKVLLPEPSRFLGMDRFLREIRIAAQLNHPHILPLHDSGEADGLLFYVMPYVEADSLRRRLAREGPLPVADAVRIAMEVADGLEYAHRLGVVHRDIKPENILLTQTHAVIADFGIARPVAREGATITTVGISLGTPDYMSPEQAAADPALDHRTDVYALGCTLYEMLTGKSPFPGPTPFAQAKRHLSEPVPSARALRREVPAALDAAVQRAMAKTAADRFATAAEFGEVLSGFVVATGRGVTPFRPAMVPHWRALATVVAVLAGVGALLIGRGRAPVGPAAPAPLRVVVRPFEDRTGHLADVADRLTESLTGLLQPIRPALEVTTYAVVAELKRPPIDTLRARFKPDRFVFGYLEAAGDSLRVRLEVVDPATHLSLGDTNVMVGSQADVATVLAEPLSNFVLHLFAREQQTREREAMVRDKAAWDLVQRAAQFMDDAEQAILLRSDQQGFHSLDLADSLLKEAQRREGASVLIAVDRARVEHARAFYVEYLAQNLPRLPAGLPDPTAEWGRARARLDSLILRHHGPAAAYELRGRVKEGLFRTLRVDYSLLDGAIADYRVATELDRSRASAWQALSSAYGSKGQNTEALVALGQAIEADDFHLQRRMLLRSEFDVALLASQNDKAELACRTGGAEAPGDQLFRDCEVQLWSRMRGSPQLAAVARAKADSLAATDSGTLSAAFREMWIAEILASAGLGDSADNVARRAMLNAPAASRSRLAPEAAYLRVLRGDPDSAVALIAATAGQDPTTRLYFRSAPWFGSLRSDPRFISAVRDGPIVH